ncbi:MAG: UvrD-helicase domain-containing protein, partial [Pseudomonadota bacterium]
QTNLARIEAHEANEKRATIRNMARAIGAVGTIADPEERLDALTKAFLKGSAEKGFDHRTQHLFPDNIVAAVPDYPAAHAAAAAHLLSIHDDLNRLDDVEQTVRMLIIGQALIARYERLKQVRGYLDFDDLIARTAAMLRRAGTGAWVRYKLDQGIDHILVDEAQDTSPLQWEVVKTFADEFFDGEAARTADRTVFAVGDEKQSIYSFQGADPAGFSAARGHFNAKVTGAAKPFEPVPLDRSFRSTGNVLAAVDLVFDNDRNVDGLTQSGGYQRHTALRTDTQGRVTVWNVHVSDPDPDMPADWAEPVDAPAKGARTLAQRMARTITRWMAGDDAMLVQGRQVTAGDILVLVRKRGPFVGELSRALKSVQVPVAGADRLILTAHIATMDLLALGKSLLNEHDELSLAAVLKSPLFGLNDDDLMALCFDRDDKTLWQQLGSSAKPSHRAAFDDLGALRTLSETRSAFDFYAHVLTALGGRQKMIARLNPETADILDEFLALAEAFERDHAGHLHLFIDHVERQAPEIKREMEQGADAVRVMTVHGAKGLEAPIVFLVDDCTAPYNGAQMDKIVTVPGAILDGGDGPDLPAWYRGRPRSSIMDAVAIQAQEAAEAEYKRLLYVGMTRAADALFVVGHTTKAEVPVAGDLRWHQMVDDALRNHAKPMETDEGAVLAFPNADPAPPAQPVEQAPPGAHAETVDSKHLAQIRAKAPHEPPPKRPLIPSGATSFAIEATRPPTEDDMIRPVSVLDEVRETPGNTGNAAARGSALHTLLQMLPDVAKPDRDALARSWLRQNGFAPADHDTLLAEVFSVIDSPAYAFLFSPQSEAEVQLMGTVRVNGEERAVSGVIDRIAVTDEKVTIIDYKTGRPPPDRKAPDVGVYQLALYGALIGQIYPGRAIETLLLYTRGPLIIEVGEGDRERALNDLAEA